MRKVINILKPRTVAKLLSFWPPYFSAGISVSNVAENMMSITVEMKQRFWNTNYVGSHFGGSLYSMCDPFFMFMLLEHLKADHIVWDQAAEIKFLKPAKGRVSVTFQIDESLVSEIKKRALNEFSFSVDLNANIVDESGEIVARVAKALYIRRKDAKTRFQSEKNNVKSVT